MSNYNERKRVVKSCKRYIETHLYDKLTLTELAQQCHVSEMSLRRYFNEIGGYSVHDYIRLRRIHMAARYLRHGGNVDTAFQTSGFASKSGFAKAFEEIIGVTPWAFADTDGVDLMEARQAKRELNALYERPPEGTKQVEVAAPPLPGDFSAEEQVQRWDQGSDLPPIPYPGNPTLTMDARFDAVRQKNPDIVGWLSVGGLLREPVVQRDNEFYMTHSSKN